MTAAAIRVATCAAALAAAAAVPSFASGRGHAVKEEKVTHVFNLNAQRLRWGEVFDAVAGAVLVIAPGRAPTGREQADVVVAALFGRPDNSVNAMTDLVLSVAGAIEAGERDVVVAMIERGRPRAPATAWSTCGMMVEIVRRVVGLDEAVVARVVPAIRMIGEHPLMLGLPS